MVAAKEAVEDAGLNGKQLRARRCGVVMGSALFNIEEIAASARKVEERGAQFAHPTAIPLINMQAQAAVIVDMLEMENVPAFCVSSACTSGMDAVGLACDMIRSGQVDAMICGGTDAPLSRSPTAEIIQAGMCSTRNDEPERASRPFDRERDNGLLAEGAGVIIIERLDLALERGANPYAEIYGAHTCRDPDGGESGSGLAQTYARRDAERPLPRDGRGLHFRLGLRRPQAWTAWKRPASRKCSASGPTTSPSAPSRP